MKGMVATGDKQSTHLQTGSCSIVSTQKIKKLGIWNGICKLVFYELFLWNLNYGALAVKPVHRPGPGQGMGSPGLAQNTKFIVLKIFFNLTFLINIKVGCAWVSLSGLAHDYVYLAYALFFLQFRPFSICATF